MREHIGPDFVGIGAQKCGTTWIANVLDQHPQVFFSPKKEISFFTRYFHKGFDWYEAIFAEKGDRLGGEISVNYLYSPRPDATRKEFYPKWNPRRKMQFWRRMPSARDELRQRYPHLDVFAIFRNPADRAWSHYWFWRRRKERLGKRVVPFERMFSDDGRWIRLQGNYADHLARWREAFPETGAFFYDDLETDPLGLARSVYRFVGIDDSFEPETQKRFLAGKYDPMPSETRRMLVDCYRSQIERLAEMTGRDLTSWLHGTSRGQLRRETEP